MNKRVKTYGQACSLACALDILGERWTLLLIRELLAGPRRFKDLVDGLSGAGTNLVATRLKTLSEKNIISKLPSTFGQQLYILTEKGEQLRDPIVKLARWGLDFTTEANMFWSPWWNPLAIESRYDGKFLKKRKCIGHIEMENTTTEVVINGMNLSANNFPKSKPDFVISLTRARTSKNSSPQFRLLKILGDKQLADLFLQSCGSSFSLAGLLAPYTKQTVGKTERIV